MRKYRLETLGIVFVVLSFFLVLLGLFPSFLPSGGLGGPLLWYSWTYSVSFYSGLGFFIIGSTSIITARNMTTGNEATGSTSTKNQNPLRRLRLNHFPIDVGIALLTGLVSLAVTTFVASRPSNDPSGGFPLEVKTPIPDCGFGPFRFGSCFGYDPLALLLDSVFWTGLAFALVTFADLITTRFAPSLGKSVDYRSP